MKLPRSSRAKPYGCANHPKHHRHASHSTCCAKQHGHQYAGRIDRHQPQTQRLAMARFGGDLVQGAHDHGLHCAQRQAKLPFRAFEPLLLHDAFFREDYLINKKYAKHQ